MRPLYSVEVIETETARFDIEISEEGVHGNWKLKGEPLTESAVSKYFTIFFYVCPNTLQGSGVGGRVTAETKFDVLLSGRVVILKIVGFLINNVLSVIQT